MGVKIIRFIHNQKVKWGVYDNKIREIKFSGETLKELLSWGIDQIRAATVDATIIDEKEIQFLSPVTSDANIYCQGANYGLHRTEAGLKQEKPEYNLMFMKASSTLTGAYSEIICPENVKLLDYEVELGLIIKQNISNPIEFNVTNLKEYIAGMVIANDVSARDIQMIEQQWFKGKSYRGFCPVGPYVYLLEDDEMEYLNKMELVLKVNGEIRQSSTTNQLLFKPVETFTEMSKIFNLDVGDLVLTGTPGGVALKLDRFIKDILANNDLSYEEKRNHFIQSQKGNGYLDDGDVISISIKSDDGKIDLGVQENVVRRMSNLNRN